MQSNIKISKKEDKVNPSQEESQFIKGLCNDINRLELAQNVFLPIVLEDLTELSRAVTTLSVKLQKEVIKQKEKYITLSDDYADLSIEYQELQEQLWDANNKIAELKNNINNSYMSSQKVHKPN